MLLMQMMVHAPFMGPGPYHCPMTEGKGEATFPLSLNITILLSLLTELSISFPRPFYSGRSHPLVPRYHATQRMQTEAAKRVNVFEFCARISSGYTPKSSGIHSPAQTHTSIRHSGSCSPRIGSSNLIIVLDVNRLISQTSLRGKIMKSKNWR